MEPRSRVTAGHFGARYCRAWPVILAMGDDPGHTAGDLDAGHRQRGVPPPRRHTDGDRRPADGHQPAAVPDLRRGKPGWNDATSSTRASGHSDELNLMVQP